MLIYYCDEQPYIYINFNRGWSIELVSFLPNASSNIPKVLERIHHNDVFKQWKYTHL